MKNVSDVAVVGLGPAGVTAAIYLKRFGFEPICFEPQIIGGKVNVTYLIENYPGFHGSGPELAQKLAEQIEFYGIKKISRQVTGIRRLDETFEIVTEDESHLFKAVIIATGMQEKPYTVPGSEKYGGRGISRCAVCDGPLFRRREVAVVGGGNSAFEEAAYLATICSKVTLINRRTEFRADAQLVNEFRDSANTEIRAPYIIADSDGVNKIETLTLENTLDKSRVEIKTEGLFVYVGATPITDFLTINGLLDNRGFIMTDGTAGTAEPGLFAAGDVRVTPLRQVATAVADGAMAAFRAKDFLKNR